MGKKLQRISRKKKMHQIINDLTMIGNFAELERIINNGHFYDTHLTSIKKMGENIAIIRKDVENLCPKKHVTAQFQKNQKQDRVSTQYQEASSISAVTKTASRSALVLKGLADEMFEYVNGDRPTEFEDKVIAMASMRDKISELEETISTMKTAIVNEILGSF